MISLQQALAQAKFPARNIYLGWVSDGKAKYMLHVGFFSVRKAFA